MTSPPGSTAELGLGFLVCFVGKATLDNILASSLVLNSLYAEKKFFLILSPNKQT